MPVFYISSNVAQELLGKNAGKKQKQKIDKTGKYQSYFFKKNITLSIKRQTKEIDSENVLAYIEGSSKKEEVIIITAHYDHLGKHDGDIYYGADDDGSGTVALLEIAQAFTLAKNAGYTPERSILIMPVSGEEKGLLGSAYYTKNPVFPLENTVANLNIDMIGRLDEDHMNNENYIYIIGSDKLSNDLHFINENCNALYSQLELNYRYNDENDPNKFYYRSDHWNFAKNNIPVIFYFNGVHDDYHKPSDTIDKILFHKMEKITRLVFHTAWKLANNPERIKLN